ncbi:transglutaminase-like domain-containing protein [Kineosporia babensis]|uniref:Transglutaminase domain-containing protein n=1 Tax=Kineosporia babensis TaxID=499548 RepID=A0A9X1NBB8_9ACTN|nr:transglutaminase domain-containing protein [Kineosporia babensis]MCD5309903.1 transglutaminase domain-containing protein [Kineosporia babensis]
MKNPPTLLTLISAALALGLAGLLPAVVCLLVMVLIGLVGTFVPTWLPHLTTASWGRSAVAGAALGLVVVLTALTGPQNLITGNASSALGMAANVLAVPAGLPLGLLAALAAGSLIAVTLEIGHRRGTQSALVLGTAVLGLACVAAPSGLRLLVPIVIGWPSALLALTRLNFLATPNPEVRTTVTRRGTGPVESTESALAAAFRWRLVPVILAIALSSGLAFVAGGAELQNLGNANAAGAAADQSASNNTRAWETKFLGGRMNLNSRGPLGDYPVAEVPADSPSHWRTANLDFYNGEGWQVTGNPGLRTTVTQSGDRALLTTDGDDSANTSGENPYSEDQTGPETSQIPEPNATPPVNPDEDLTNPADPGDLGIGNDDLGVTEDFGLDGGANTLDGNTVDENDADQSGNTRTDQVVIRGNGTSQLIAPGRVLSADLPSDYAERTFVSTGDRVLLPSEDEDSYTVSSLVYPDTSNPASIGTAFSDDNTGVDPRYLQVPENLPVRVRDLGQQLVSAAPDRLAAVKAVEARLAETMSYTLDAPVPPPGRDAVDFALFESHQGFCEHYASAAVMLLRSGGIPARMVVGYLAQGQELLDGGRQMIRQAQAHAWAEVWFPGVGWVTSEATPPGGLQRGFLDGLNQTFNRVTNDLVTRASAFFSGVLGPVLLAGVLLGLWLFRRFLLRRIAQLIARFRKHEPIGDVRPPYDPALRKAFQDLETALAAQGAARADNETLTELRNRLVGPRYYTAPEQKDALEGAFDVLNRALYSATTPGSEECRRAAAVFEQETERLNQAQPVASLGQSAQLM